MALNPALKALASKLSTQFGQACTLRKITVTTNPATDSVSESITDCPCSGVIEEYSLGEVRGLIQQGDQKIMLPASQLTFIPEAGQQLLTEGKTYRVIYAQRTGMEGQAIIYQLTLRV